jgi:ketosteroid isomerase-like protein
MNEAVDRIVQAFESLSPESVARLDAIYAPDAGFKDPFNDVQGLPEIQRIFAHMFEALVQPRFVITQRVVQGQQCFLCWEFRFAFKQTKPGQPQCIFGATHLMLDSSGRIVMHRDYWDAAEELYEKLPWIGGLMRWLKKRAST